MHCLGWYTYICSWQWVCARTGYLHIPYIGIIEVMITLKHWHIVINSFVAQSRALAVSLVLTLLVYRLQLLDGAITGQLDVVCRRRRRPNPGSPTTYTQMYTSLNCLPWNGCLPETFVPYFSASFQSIVWRPPTLVLELLHDVHAHLHILRLPTVPLSDWLTGCPWNGRRFALFTSPITTCHQIMPITVLHRYASPSCSQPPLHVIYVLHNHDLYHGRVLTRYSDRCKDSRVTDPVVHYCEDAHKLLEHLDYSSSLSEPISGDSVTFDDAVWIEFNLIESLPLTENHVPSLRFVTQVWDRSKGKVLI